MSELDSRLKGELIYAVLNSENFSDSCDIFSFEGEDGIKRFQAVANSNIDPSIAVVFSIPTVGRNIYVTVTDGDINIVRRVIANLEDIEREGGVKLGNVQLFNSNELAQNGICGVILLQPKVSNVIDYLPDKIKIDSTEFQFLLVVFLGEKEHMIWKNNGHDALMDFFIEEEKDLISFKGK